MVNLVEYLTKIRIKVPSEINPPPYQKESPDRIKLPDIKNHEWVTQNGIFSTDCCYRKIEVTEAEVQNSVVRILPNKLKTTISVQAMIKNKSFSLVASGEKRSEQTESSKEC